MAEATVVLRWERLAGRLAAELAGRKLQLLLYWLQLQLSFTEGCSSRSNWLSGKVRGHQHALYRRWLIGWRQTAVQMRRCKSGF